jgi:hypothetical protein
MSKNRGVVYTKPGEVEVQDIADPKLENPQGRKIDHGVILKRARGSLKWWSRKSGGPFACDAPYVTSYIEGFSHFVTSMTAPVALAPAFARKPVPLRS